MSKVPNRPDPGDPYAGAPAPYVPTAGWAARGLAESLPRHLAVDHAPGDVAWYPPTSENPEPRPVTRAAVFEVIAAAVAGGAPAPIRVEFADFPSGPQLDVQMPDGDRTGVTLFATIFGLPLPTESNFTTEGRRGMGRARVFGASSARQRATAAAATGEDQVRGLAAAAGWVVAVNCYVPGRTRDIADRLVRTEPDAVPPDRLQAASASDGDVSGLRAS